MIETIFREFKSNPGVALKRPYFVLLVPYFIFRVLRNRWHSIPQTIYLTETALYGHKLLLKSLPERIRLIELEINSEVHNLIKRRVEEDPYVDNYGLIVTERIKSGDKIFCLVNETDYCSYVFVSERIAKLQQVGVEINLPIDCFALYDVYTFKNYRSKGLYELLVSAIFKRMFQKGYKTCWLWVMRHNKISIVVHQKLGINHVIREFTEYFRFGFRRYKEVIHDFYLAELFNDGQ